VGTDNINLENEVKQPLKMERLNQQKNIENH